MLKLCAGGEKKTPDALHAGALVERAKPELEQAVERGVRGGFVRRKRMEERGAEGGVDR